MPSVELTLRARTIRLTASSRYLERAARPLVTKEVSGRLSLAVVFLISRRCNLQCTYCNVDASPRSRTALDPRQFEAWVRALAELGDLDLGIQLHGGEPLMLDPSVEVLASIARNAVIPYPTSSMAMMGVVTNGIFLDADRARRLIDAGLRVVLSLDGPQRLHDRHRLTASGRGSHRQTMRGLAALRSVDPNPSVIAVISQPSDVAEVIEFFTSEGVSRVKINPIRPEGRGAAIRGDTVAGHMVALADAYFEAAKTLAAHNQRRPEQPIYEENIAILMARVIAGETGQPGAASWTLLVDDRGRLWSHPGGYGVEHMALTTGEPPSAEILSRALGVAAKERAERMMLRQRATFRPCAGCVDPLWCSGFRPVVGGPAVSADCVWRDRLMSRLEAWWHESPSDAISALPVDSVNASRPASDAPLPHGSADTVTWLDEPIEPAVRALVASVRIGTDGSAYIKNFADRVIEVRGLDPFSSAHAFRQLAALACWYAGRNDRIALARSLACLAQVGLEHLARRTADRPGPPGTTLERSGRK
jgi:sulfatase maturation enzyme AslB (radical SAM superfamily)